MKGYIPISADSEIIGDISSKSPTYMELSFVGLVDLENNSDDVEDIYVIAQNDIIPLADVANVQQNSYFVFNIITDTDNFWICY